MYKEDLALNNLRWLICHKTKLNQSMISVCMSLSLSLYIYIYIYIPLCTNDAAQGKFFGVNYIYIDNYELKYF